jgi:uncharacterized protein (DUF697 family)
LRKLNISYKDKVSIELRQWVNKIHRKPSLTKVVAKKLQMKVNEKIPEKIHRIITKALKGMIEATISGSKYTTKLKKDPNQMTFEEKESYVKERLQFYRKIAVAEGAGTGAGGIFLGMADFPLLLTIKMKFLMECAMIYGFNPNKLEERIFLLHIFQMSFSSDEHKKKIYEEILRWDNMDHHLNDEKWRKLQQEYRDYIDLAKLFQLLPGIGAVVGAYANYNLMDELGETAMNCFRMRTLN